MTDQVNSAPLQRDRVTGSSSNGDMSTQQKLFEKVALILASKEINVEGEGSISLDIDDNGNIEVIGNIKNKNEIAGELNKDEDLKSFLTAGLSDQGVVASEYSQPVDTIEVSDDAIQAYQDGVKNTPSANYISIYNLDQINNDSSIPNNSQTGDSSPLIGVV